MKTKIICILVMTLLIASMIIPVASSNTINKLFAPGVIDQSQTDASEEHWLDWSVPNWQSFIHKGEMLEEVELFFGCWFSGSADVTLSIEESVGGPPLTKITHQATDFPIDQCNWFTFDVPNVKLNANQIYFIVIRFDIGSEYCWHGAHGNPYTPGGSSHPDTDWDYAFRTIVDKKSKNIQVVSPGVIDQEQTDASEVDFLDNGMPHWQQFKNRGNIIEEVDVHMGCWFGGSADITLSIRETVDGPILTKKTHVATDLPENYQAWFTFDVEPNVRLKPDKIYYIVIQFGAGSEYEWSGAHSDPYPAGSSSHPDADWDYAFRTIVDKSKTRAVNTPLLNFFKNHLNMFPLLQLLLQRLGIQ